MINIFDSANETIDVIITYVDELEGKLDEAVRRIAQLEEEMKTLSARSDYLEDVVSAL